MKTLGACHIEWLEMSTRRQVCLFETAFPPVERLRKVSHRWARLTLLLDYEDGRIDMVTALFVAVESNAN
jgi:hypothetical protein